MRRAFLGLALVGLLIVSCGPRAPNNVRVRVEVVGATIGLAKTDGTGWDGGVVPVEVLKGVAALAVAPYLGPKGGLIAAELVGLVERARAAGAAPPDPFGVAELDRGSGGGFLEARDLRRDGSIAQDTYSPVFEPPATWHSVMLNDRLRLRVHLIDDDTFGSEDIGVVDIDETVLRDALAAHGVYQVYVGKQSGNQILYVSVTVTPEF